jgi:ORF6N domain
MPAETANAFESQVIAHLRPLRGHAVILDSDLAWFLGIEPERIAGVMEHRPELFPSDFVFHLTADELTRFEKESPCLTANGTVADRKRAAFTTHGVGMLLLAFPEKKFSLAAIPVLRAIASYWKIGAAAHTTQPLVNRKS